MHKSLSHICATFALLSSLSALPSFAQDEMMGKDKMGGGMMKSGTITKDKMKGGMTRNGKGMKSDSMAYHRRMMMHHQKQMMMHKRMMNPSKMRGSKKG